jgi:hypothetical protein
MKHTGLPKQAGRENIPFIQQICDWISILGKAGCEQDTLILLTNLHQELVNKGTLQDVHLIE